MRFLTTLVGTGAALAACAGSAGAQTLFGSGCAGASGVTPTVSMSGTVATGQQWQLNITSPAGTGLEYLIVGFSNTSASFFGGLPLPFDLGILLSDPLWSGCPLNVDPNYLIQPYFFNPAANGGLHTINLPGFNFGAAYLQVINVDADFITRIAGVSQGIEIVPSPPSGPQPGDLVITEIMKDPAAVGDNLGEWFEILNKTGAAIDIEGWTLRDDGTDSMVLANGGSGILVPANSYFVLGNNSNSGTNGGVTVNFQWNGSMALGNSDDEIVLVEPGLVEIARVNYDNGITFPDSAGLSMGLDVAFLNEFDNDNGSNWANSTCFLPNPSTDKGTPGIANDQCNVTPPGPGSGELIFSEIMKNPAVVGDTYGEWFEVYNTTGGSIDMSGWTVTSGPNSFVVSGSFVIPSGGYGVFLRNGNPTENGGLDPMVINAYDYASAIILGNAGQTIEIFDGGLSKIASIVYDSVTFPDTNGRSIVLDPTLAQNLTNSLNGNNWCFSTSSYTGDGLDDGALPVTNVTQYGTPAGANDTCPITPSGSPTGNLVVTEVMYNGLAETNEQDWFELYNASGLTIDINGYILTDSDGGYHIINNGAPLNVGAGARITLAASNNTLVNGGFAHGYAYDGIFLDTFADSIIVATGAGAIVAQIDYNGGAGWPVANPGHSLILDPTIGTTHNNSTNGLNWCKSYFTTYGSAANYGTPGGANDACPIEPSGAPTGELIVTEVLPDGASAGEGEEFFEIYNTTGSAIDIDGYILADLDNDYHVISNGGALLVPAGGYVTLGASNASLVNGGTTHNYVYGKDMFLGNTVDEIVLANAAGAVVCQIVYDNGATYPANTAGASMILDPAAAQTQSSSADGTNWCISSSSYGDATNDGTPGAANDSCGGGPVAANPGDVIITEIMQNPSGNPPNSVSDANGEYFEMYNTTGNSIDLNGWVFSDAVSNTFTVTTPLVIAPGGYLVFGVNSTFATNGGVTVNYDWGTSSNYTLGNASDSIIAKDSFGTTICSVAYDDGATFPDPTGASMNLDAASFTLAQSQVGTNWCTTSSSSLLTGGDFGTPGAANELCP